MSAAVGGGAGTPSTVFGLGGVLGCSRQPAAKNNTTAAMRAAVTGFDMICDSGSFPVAGRIPQVGASVSPHLRKRVAGKALHSGRRCTQGEAFILELALQGDIE
jgi:hypothetical protein